MKIAVKLVLVTLTLLFRQLFTRQFAVISVSANHSNRDCLSNEQDY